MGWFVEAAPWRCQRHGACRTPIEEVPTWHTVAVPKGKYVESVERRCAACDAVFWTDVPRKIVCSQRCRNRRQAQIRYKAYAAMPVRPCSSCKKVLPSTAFTAHGNRCKECQQQYAETYRVANPTYRRMVTLRRHRLTVPEFEALLASQGGGCAICHRAEPFGHGVWHIDHDHACCSGSYGCRACVRGVLCHYCNLMIGMAGDQPDRLVQAAEYLQVGATKRGS